MDEFPEITHYRYFQLGYKLVRVGYTAENHFCLAEYADLETKDMEIDNTLLHRIFFQNPDMLEELEEHRFAELWLQKGVKSRPPKD